MLATFRFGLCRHFALASTGAAVIGVLALSSACSAPNPTTGRRQLAATKMSEQEEVQIGNEQKPEMIKEYGGEVTDPQIKAYLTDIGRRLAGAAATDDPKLSNLPWEFTLLDSDVINAFALPGGKIFVSRALVEQMTNEAQLAAVVGHEIGHVAADHTSERYGQQIAIVGGTTVLGAVAGALLNSEDRAAGAGMGAGAGAALGGVATLSYSRDQESEADRLGMRYMERLKYNPQGAVQVQEILLREEQKGGSQLEILSTHPSSQTRIDDLNARIKKYYQHAVDNPEYQLYEDRFKQQCLTKLLALPRPKPVPQQQPAQGQQKPQGGSQYRGRH
jgi:predicted Zn-dependent protease